MLDGCKQPRRFFGEKLTVSRHIQSDNTDFQKDAISLDNFQARVILILGSALLIHIVDRCYADCRLG